MTGVYWFWQTRRVANESRTVNDRYLTVDIDNIVPHPDNPRRGNVSLIKESIRANGFYGAIYVQKSTGRIVVGEHRWRAAKELGYKKVPVIYLEVGDKEAKKIMLADNRTSDVAGWDEAGLAKMLEEYNALGELGHTGFDEAALAELLAKMDVPEFGAASEDDQSRLDERAKLKCPKCGYEFEA